MATYILTSMFPDGFNRQVAEQLNRVVTVRGKFAFVASEFKKMHEKTDKYFELFLRMFSEIDITFEQAYVVDGRMSYEEAQEAIREADVVWLSGGDTPTQYSYFKEYGLNSVIRKHQGVIIGMSAGSINMARTSICTLSCGHHKQEIYEGLGCLDLSVEPHFVKENVSQELLELSKTYEIYGLCDESIIVNQGSALSFYGEVYRLCNAVVEKVNS